jgi:aminocarboxymuconate-semialdehyde decarboxylase
VTGPRVDVHCHYIPPTLLELIEAEGAAHSIALTNDGRVSFAGRVETQAFPHGMVDLDARLAWMNEEGIDVQVLSSWMDFSAYALDAEDGAWLARALNELTASAIEPRAERLRAMAAVPLQAPELAAEELRFAIEELGMVAVEIATSVVEAELDDPALEPFWDAAEALDAVVLVHPFASIGSERLGRYFLNNIVGNPAEETVAAAHLLYGGVLERHPRLRVCLTHGGGFLPYQIGRQDRGYEALPRLTAARLSEPPSSSLRRFYYDTVVHGAEALRFLVARVGADRVLLGSDYPFPMGDPHPVATVRAAGLEIDDESAILGRNAVAALDLAAAPPGSDENRRQGMEHSFLAHDDADDVGVAVRDVARGSDVVVAYLKGGSSLTLTALGDIPLGHKIALRDLEQDAEVLKYGIPIGRATQRLRAGDYVHTHNLRSARW